MPRVSRSIEINATADAAWATVRDFNGLPAWCPGIVASEIEEDADATTVGAIRRLTLTDGGTLRETLLELSETDRRCSYDIVDSAGLPLSDYVATLSVAPQGSTCEMSWEAAWTSPADAEAQMIEMIEMILQRGLEAAKAKTEG
jgi:Polyketide cyclase / dehydrase and lipid transport